MCRSIQVYYWFVDKGPEGDRIGVKYLYADSIMEWAKEATDDNGVLNKDLFAELVNENAEEFVVENDGTGDFVSLNNSWGESTAWSYQDVIAWAQKVIEKEVKPSLAGQIQSACGVVADGDKAGILSAKDFEAER